MFWNSNITLTLSGLIPRRPKPGRTKRFSEVTTHRYRLNTSNNVQRAAFFPLFIAVLQCNLLGPSDRTTKYSQTVNGAAIRTAIQLLPPHELPFRFAQPQVDAGVQRQSKKEDAVVGVPDLNPVALHIIPAVERSM